MPPNLLLTGRPGVELVEVTPANRDHLEGELAARLQQWLAPRA